MGCAQQVNATVLTSALVAIVVALAASRYGLHAQPACHNVPVRAARHCAGGFDDSGAAEGAQEGGVGPATGDMLSSLYFGSMVQQRFMSSDHLLYRASVRGAQHRRRRRCPPTQNLRRTGQYERALTLVPTAAAMRRSTRSPWSRT